MAKKTDADERSVLTNMRAREACIQDAYKRIYELRREKERLEEEHLTEVKEGLKKAWRTLKADVDMERKDLELTFKVYERERMAKELMDEDEDSNRVQDNLREAFSALIAGNMVNFIDVIDNAA